MSTRGWLLILSVIGFGVYGSGLDIPYYGDDFQHVFDPSPSNVLYYFFHKNPYNHHIYRPVNESVLGAIQTFWGLNTAPVHLITLSLHLLLAWLLFVVIIKMGFSRVQAMIGSAFMVISQANAHAVLSNDTLSQVSGTYFGCVSLWLASRAWFADPDTRAPLHSPRPNQSSVLGVFAFCLSLLSKETSFAFFVLLLISIVLMNRQRPSQSILLKSALIETGPYFLAVILYFVARWLMGIESARFGSGGYDIHPGLNILKNLAMLSFAAWIPLSSVTAFLAFKNGNLVGCGMTVLASFLFFACVVYGLWSARRRRLLILLSVFAITGFFPVALMNHVSELYAYNAMPFLAILVGVGLGRLFEITKTRWISRAAVTGFVGLVFLSHVMAIQSKASLMKNNGTQATILLGQIQSYLQKAPKNGELVLLNPPDDREEYSVFLMNGFNVLQYGLNRIEQLAGRNDFEIKIMDRTNLDHTRLRHPSLILSLQGGMVSIYQDQ